MHYTLGHSDLSRDVPCLMVGQAKHGFFRRQIPIAAAMSLPGVYRIISCWPPERERMVPASTCQPRDATSTVCKSIPDISLSYTCSEKRANPICSKCEIYNIICGHCGSKFFAGRRLALPANSRAKKPLRAQISFTESNPNMENTKRACDKKTINCSKYCHRWSTIVFWWLSTLLLDWIACFQFATHFIFVFELEVCYRLHALNFDKKMWAACVPPWMKFEGWLSLINSQLLNDVEWWPIFKPPESSVAKLSSFLEADDRDSVYGLRIKKSCYRPSLLRVWDSATPLTTYACGFLKLPKLVSEISRQHVYHCDGDIQNMWENPETPRFTAMTADMLKMHMHENALNDAHGSEIKTALFLPETIVYHRFLVKRIMSYIPATSFSSCRIRW